MPVAAYAPPPDACYSWGQFEVLDIERHLAKGGVDVDLKLGKISGLASTEHVDDDGETIVQRGINWSPFTKGGGFLTVEHPAGVLNVVGEPTGIELTEHDGMPATRFFGDVYLTDALGQATFRKAVNIQKAGGRHRLGTSIEGNADLRDPKNKKRVLESTVWSLAITSQPRNRKCRFDPIMASLAASTLGKVTQGEPSASGQNGAGELAPMVPQSLAGGTCSGNCPACCGRSTVSKGAARFLADMELTDLAVARLLQQLPQLTWAEGLAHIQAHHQGVNR
jgi:hypothetical protein